jgi:hypothetical protein
MKLRIFAELYDSAEDLLTEISCFGHIDINSNSGKIDRLSNALISTRSEMPEKLDDELQIKENHINHTELAPKEIGMLIAKMNREEVAKVIEYASRSNLMLINKESSFINIVSIEEIQKMYKKFQKKECSIKIAERIILELQETFSTKLSIEQQCKTIISSIQDTELTNLLEW